MNTDEQPTFGSDNEKTTELSIEEIVEKANSSNIDSKYFIRTNITTFRTQSNVPSQYQLVLKKDGTLVLQGLFIWQEGLNTSGSDWRDIPTVHEE